MNLVPINQKQIQKNAMSVSPDLAWALPLVQAQKTPQAKQAIEAAKALAEQRLKKENKILFLVK